MRDIQLSQHFKLSEMIKSDMAIRYGIDNYPQNQGIIDCLKIVCGAILELCREQFGPIIPTSGYRNPVVNKLVGSKSENSQHLYGQAVDFEIPGVSNYEIALWIKNNIHVYDQLILECYVPGVPNSGWVHCSVKSGGNRHQDLTYSGGEYKNGLIK